MRYRFNFEIKWVYVDIPDGLSGDELEARLEEEASIIDCDDHVSDWDAHQVPEGETDE